MKKTEKEQLNDSGALEDKEGENLRRREWSAVKCHQEWKKNLTRDFGKVYQLGKEHSFVVTLVHIIV